MPEIKKIADKARVILENNTELTKAQLEEQFGTEEALGIRFLVISPEGNEMLLSPSELEVLTAKIGPVEVESLFPDGLSAACCTNYAIQVCRAYPDRTMIFGFANLDNPFSEIAANKIHPGGHDFAVIDGRFLVDPWIKLVADDSDRVVFDLTYIDELSIVNRRYGMLWRRMTVAEEEAKRS